MRVIFCFVKLATVSRSGKKGGVRLVVKVFTSCYTLVPLQEREATQDFIKQPKNKFINKQSRIN
ncbi:hypothetical protein [Campylobacter troglodytis]|uniref:hypothetical protein n=1 Tax=Campylobacter troglodytis TaxID=654363 RepID=UPI001157F26C|nr:hypothetical protein [Campylobacter troglodytis]